MVPKFVGMRLATDEDGTDMIVMHSQLIARQPIVSTTSQRGLIESVAAWLRGCVAGPMTNILQEQLLGETAPGNSRVSIGILLSASHDLSRFSLWVEASTTEPPIVMCISFDASQVENSCNYLDKGLRPESQIGYVLIKYSAAAASRSPSFAEIPGAQVVCALSGRSLNSAPDVRGCAADSGAMGDNAI
ncbi:uncharacterized protein PADG_11607 [Paracoccidioides brasiliensis Pb18]|uniref:Uncharacterized protein n=1 Tax=Paracoccidioides brasiliensis (strain Pb18) TaxID=502780 RepID=A0A0A0HT73_PARBD|nr:uncharacterized protein PADG_11607 [Paracoccidioides brasiliensis Pb18]KGM92404.1 hypothetical protein PADG_11607 [Paracoccidioides brasiliensis Pb18]